MALTREAIVLTAAELVDRYGLGDLSMRRLATELGVAPGALYWHLTNKQELLGHLARHVLAPVPAPDQPTTVDALVGWGVALHDHLLEHRDSAELVLSAAALATWAEPPWQPVTDALARAGRPPAAAEVGAHTLWHAVTGTAFHNQLRHHAAHDEARRPPAELDVRATAWLVAAAALGG